MSWYGIVLRSFSQPTQHHCLMRGLSNGKGNTDGLGNM